MIDVARGRAELRRIVASGARRVLRRADPAALAAPSAVAQPQQGRSGPAAPRGLGVERASATLALHGRLAPHEIAAVEACIAAHAELQELYERVIHPDRERFLMAIGIHLGVPGIAERTGLPTAQPPEQVHAMARGALAAAGGLYEADLVADALASAHVELAAKRAALDFGCSSGRVVRVLSAACPQIAWHGCDPNADAIAWAREAIPGVRFFRSGDRPPLDLPDGSLDLVYAISVWSHFAPELGLAWFEEMRRLLRPGGHLVMTTHGATTIEHDGANGLRSTQQLDEIARALATRRKLVRSRVRRGRRLGCASTLTGAPRFCHPNGCSPTSLHNGSVLEFAPGRNAGNQDVYVLKPAVASVQSP